MKWIRNICLTLAIIGSILATNIIPGAAISAKLELLIQTSTCVLLFLCAVLSFWGPSDSQTLTLNMSKKEAMDKVAKMLTWIEHDALNIDRDKGLITFLHGSWILGSGNGCLRRVTIQVQNRSSSEVELYIHSIIRFSLLGFGANQAILQRITNGLKG